MDFVQLLPPELTEKVLSYVSAVDLIHCGEVSKLWSQVTNDWKQRLINNWKNGKYIKLCLSLNRPSKFVLPMKVDIDPSPLLDCIYYPVMKSGSDNEFCFFRLCIENTSKPIKEITTLTYPEEVRKVCVMRDCVVWLDADKVLYLDTKCDLETSTVKTLGYIVGDKFSVSWDGSIMYPRFLAMDTHHIVAASDRCLKVWCKETHELKWESKSPNKLPQRCSFYDGCLIISTRTDTGTENNTSHFEIHNMRNKYGNTLQHEFDETGYVACLESNKRFIVTLTIDSQDYYHILVRDKETYAIKFSHPVYRYFRIYELLGNFVISRGYENRINVLNIISGEMFETDSPTHQFIPVFGDIVVKRIQQATIEVWDLKRNVKLYSLTEDNPSTNLEIAYVSESKIVVVDLEHSKFIVYKFW